MKHTIALNRNGMFQRLYSKGTSHADKNVAVYILPNRLNINRLGITVGKKIGCAVLRNRAKRLIKESYRLKETLVKSGFDIVIVARKNIINADFWSVSKSVETLLLRHGILEMTNE